MAAMLATAAALMLVAFVLGIVTGAHIASGRMLPWRAKSRQAATAEALNANLAVVAAHLEEARRPAPARPAAAAVTLPARDAVILDSQAARAAIEGRNHT